LKPKKKKTRTSTGLTSNKKKRRLDGRVDEECVAGTTGIVGSTQDVDLIDEQKKKMARAWKLDVKLNLSPRRHVKKSVDWIDEPVEAWSSWQIRNNQ